MNNPWLKYNQFQVSINFITRRRMLVHSYPRIYNKTFNIKYSLKITVTLYFLRYDTVVSEKDTGFVLLILIFPCNPYATSKFVLKHSRMKTLVSS